MPLFVTGTDTGCGKTVVSCALLRALARMDIRAIGMKPVATGAKRDGERLINEDVEALRAASSTSLPPAITNPYIFEPPCSPHIAAAQAGTPIELDRIATAYKACIEKADEVVVEGVGGWCVPLGNDLWLDELPRALELPVLLVVGVKLGCINHAVLTAQAIERSGARLFGWVANVLEPSLFELETVIETLTAHIPAPRLAVLDWAPGATPAERAPHLGTVAAKLSSETPLA